MDFECDKTNYSIKDHFNHYGLCLLLYFHIIEQFQPLKIEVLLCNDNKFSSFIPCILSNSSIANTFINISISILRLERTYSIHKNSSKNSFINNYIFIVENILNYNNIVKKYFKFISNDLKQTLFYEIIVVLKYVSDKDLNLSSIEILIDNLFKDYPIVVLSSLKIEDDNKFYDKYLKIISNKLLNVRNSIRNLDQLEINNYFNFLAAKSILTKDDTLMYLIKIFGKKSSTLSINNLLDNELEKMLEEAKSNKNITLKNNSSLDSSDLFIKNYDIIHNTLKKISL